MSALRTDPRVVAGAPVDEHTAGHRLRDHLFAVLLRDAFAYQRDNRDLLRFPLSRGERWKHRLIDAALSTCARLGFVRPPHFLARSSHLASTLQRLDRLEQCYESLNDSESREMLVELLAFRILGPRHVKLRLNTPRYRQLARTARDGALLVERDRVRTASGWRLNHYRLPGSNGSLELYCHPLNVLNTFLLEQYVYQHGRQLVSVAPGDVVIDAGACWGDTTLYFADRVGPEGRVYSFEFAPENLEILVQNVELNPGVRPAVQIVSKALWERTGAILSFDAHGPGTAVNARQAGALGASTVTIDDFVAEEGLRRVDLLKMDIEGSELAALRGAERTLRRFLPKLAIAVYHGDEDLVRIPEYVQSLGLPYDLFLDHFSIHKEETVLFACPRAV